MPANEYHFVTRWRVEAAPDEVFALLDDPADLVRWWPSVYLDVCVAEPGDENGVGALVELYTKGWLPYTLRWRFRVREKRPPVHLAIEALGDFVGRGVWTLSPAGTGTEVVYDWRIRAEKPLLRALSFALKPLFAANHHWAMDRGEESLRLELARRHAPTAEARARVPAPPAPTPSSPLRWLRAVVSG
ncbi:MAG TPA: SRPBCC family protein [Longimicrobiaceae bacterium]|nr:SRPBCC family protein [Longimicrobiaceae bacterium]